MNEDSSPTQKRKPFLHYEFTENHKNNLNNLN